MTDWVNFSLVIGFQLLLFLLVAFRKKDLNISKIFPSSIILVVLFGIFFDLVIGKYFGIFDYILGFGLKFLFINSLLSYGLMMATVWLLRSEKFFVFYARTISVGIIYEFANYLFPVWSWKFIENFVYQELVTIFAAYFALAVLLSIVLSVTTSTRFKYLNLK